MHANSQIPRVKHGQIGWSSVDVEERRLTDDPGNIMEDQEGNLIDEEQTGKESEFF